MRILHNRAWWVLLSANALFWASDAVLGTTINRDVVDFASIAISLVIGLRLLPDAVDRFRRGGGQGRWQLLMSNVLFWFGWASFCTWTILVRAYDRPEWMAASPLNAYFKFWILSAGVLAYFATSDTPARLPPHRMYYVGIGVLAGVLAGLWLAQGILP